MELVEDIFISSQHHIARKIPTVHWFTGLSTKLCSQSWPQKTDVLRYMTVHIWKRKISLNLTRILKMYIALVILVMMLKEIFAFYQRKFQQSYRRRMNWVFIIHKNVRKQWLIEKRPKSMQPENIRRKVLKVDRAINENMLFLKFVCFSFC